MVEREALAVAFGDVLEGEDPLEDETGDGDEIPEIDGGEPPR